MAEGHDSRVRFLLLAEGHDEQQSAGTKEVTTSSGQREVGNRRRQKSELINLHLDFRLLALAFKNQNNWFISNVGSVFQFFFKKLKTEPINFTFFYITISVF